MIIHKRATIGVVLVLLAFAAQVRPVLAQDDRIQKIEQRLNALEQRVAGCQQFVRLHQGVPPCRLPHRGDWFVLRVMGAELRRDFWLWFTAGLVFNLFALIAVLDAHEKDQKAKRSAAKEASKEAMDLL